MAHPFHGLEDARQRQADALSKAEGEHKGGTVLRDIITGVQTLHLEPNDILVLMAPGLIPPAHLARIYESLERHLPNRKVMVLENGMTVARITSNQRSESQ